MELLVVVVIIAALAALVVGMVDRSREDAELGVARASMKAIAEAIMGSAAGSGYLADMKPVPGFRAADMRVHDLFSASSHPAHAGYDPVARRGWRGPYLRPGVGPANTESVRAGRFPADGDRRFSGDATFAGRGFSGAPPAVVYGLPGDVSLGDPWGNPYVIQTPPSAAFAMPADDARRFSHSRVVSAGPDGILTTPPDRLAGMLADGRAPARGDDLVLFMNRVDAYEEETP